MPSATLEPGAIVGREPQSDQSLAAPPASPVLTQHYIASAEDEELLRQLAAYERAISELSNQYQRGELSLSELAEQLHASLAEYRALGRHLARVRNQRAHGALSPGPEATDWEAFSRSPNGLTLLLSRLARLFGVQGALAV